MNSMDERCGNHTWLERWTKNVIKYIRNIIQFSIIRDNSKYMNHSKKLFRWMICSVTLWIHIGKPVTVKRSRILSFDLLHFPFAGPSETRKFICLKRKLNASIQMDTHSQPYIFSLQMFCNLYPFISVKRMIFFCHRHFSHFEFYIG